MTKLNDLLKQKEALEKAIAEQLTADKAPVIEAIKKQIKQFDITAKELGFKTTRTKKSTGSVKEILEPKYKNGLFTWTGQGRAPNWMKENGKVSETLKTKYAIKK